MSFGFGVGDFIAVGKLAWSVYKSCKDAPESFSNISTEVLSLHAVLKEVEEALADEPLTESKQRSLATVGNGCHGVLSDLQALVVKYESLGSQSRRTWDRMRWGSNDIAELRARLTSNTMLLTAFLVTSQVTVERKLNKFVEEFQDGKHEGSVITVATVDSLAPDEKETWREIRKELETIGISVVAFDANRSFIMDWFHAAIQSGAFEENGVDSDDELYTDDIAATTLGPLSSQELPMPGRLLPELPSSHIGPRHIDKRQLAPNNPNEAYTNKLQPSTALALTGTNIGSNIPNPQRVPNTTRIAKLIVAQLFGYSIEFFDVCKNCDLERASKLLQRGVDVNWYYRGSTPLGLAAARGDIAMASWLLDSGAKINRVDKNSESPLFLSIQEPESNQHVYMAEMLLRRGADVNGSRRFGPSPRNPLHEAARKGNLKAVVLLLQYGAEIRRDQDFSLLKPAAEGGYDDVVRILLDHIENSGEALQSEDFLAAFGTCVRYGQRKCLECFLDYGADVNSRITLGQPVLSDRSVLLESLDGGRYDIAKILLERGAVVDWMIDYWSITKFLTDGSTSSEYSRLVGKRVDLSSINKHSLTPLDWAMASQHFGIAEQFLELGAKSNVKFWKGYAGATVFIDTPFTRQRILAGYEMFDSI
ncbi:hypothetical protein IFR05_004494 [Cadophora sp. M221]|nr:hypothetical protein IFR05_004494 [Cadophora sp. M221]